MCMSKYTGGFPSVIVTIRYTGKGTVSRKYLKKGDNSDEVKKLQKFLNWAINAKLVVDGDFGDKTLKAVKDFQTKCKLTVDGYFGEASLKAAKSFEKAYSTPTTPSTGGKVKMKGVDISYYQGNISVDNFKKAKSKGISFVILRLGYTGSVSKKPTLDSCFENNYKNAVKAGLPVGVYYYSLATTTAMAKKEAEYCITHLKGKNIDFPVYIDMEDEKFQGKSSKATLASVCDTFCKVIKSGGYIAGVYANTYWFNHKIGKITAKHTKWVAQYYKKCEYKGAYDMWQYTSSENVAGIAKNTDTNWCYKDFTKVKKPEVTINTPVVVQKTYDGQLPSLALKKNNAEVIADAIRFALWIVNNNDFHYGYTSKDKKINAHHNGCYFCGTNTTKGGRSKKGIVMYEHTYCCNPFVHACWAHGGCVPKALEICQKGRSWDFHKGRGYDASSLFEKLGHPDMSKLKKGDVLCRDTHVALYIGDGKIAEAGGGDDNKKYSDKWNNSIRVRKLTKDNYKNFPREYRFKGSVNASMPLRHGEVSDRVPYWQTFLNWYFKGEFFKKCGTSDRYFGDNTKKWTEKFQKETGLAVDGIVGTKTLAKAKVVKR